MVDRIYYAAILSVLTGLIVWAIKAFVGNALEAMAREISHVNEGVQRVDIKLGVKTEELKEHFEKTCVERQIACGKVVGKSIEKLERHGHRGLTGDDNRHTY